MISWVRDGDYPERLQQQGADSTGFITHAEFCWYQINGELKLSVAGILYSVIWLHLNFLLLFWHLNSEVVWDILHGGAAVVQASMERLLDTSQWGYYGYILCAKNSCIILSSQEERQFMLGWQSPVVVVGIRTLVMKQEVVWHYYTAIKSVQGGGRSG